MQEEQNHATPSRGASRPLRKPPYGMPLRRRSRLNSDSLWWRPYATPTPPKRPSARQRNRRVRRTLTALLVACLGFGIWSTAWETNSAVPRTNAGSLPTPRPSVAGGSATVPAPPTPTPISTPSAAPKPERTTAKKAASSRNRHRRVVSAVPRQRHDYALATPYRKTPIRTDRRKESRSSPARDRDRRRTVPLVAAHCDELFPPSRPGSRMRNYACRQLLG